jgi:hypothetical protein
MVAGLQARRRPGVVQSDDGQCVFGLCGLAATPAPEERRRSALRSRAGRASALRSQMHSVLLELRSEPGRGGQGYMRAFTPAIGLILLQVAGSVVRNTRRRSFREGTALDVLRRYGWSLGGFAHEGLIKPTGYSTQSSIRRRQVRLRTSSLVTTRHPASVVGYYLLH